MIKSKSDYLYYLEADRISLSKPINIGFKDWLLSLIFPDYIWLFQKNLRKLEYYTNCRKGVFSYFYKIMLLKKHNRLSLKLGFSIPMNVFGPGLSIAHYGTIIVNGGARVGANCRLHASVNIGTMAGYSNKAPSIGDNCYIGPGAKIYGDIVIGNRIAIGANAVVNKSFIEDNIAIGGIPAKKIGDINVFEILIPGTELCNRKMNIDNSIVGLSAKELYQKYKF
ncbi:MAG: serine acetyltransferase [Bacteroidetes bacterium]|nr:serine acetyltransferase [Bacteroidota bacterium]